MCRQGHYGDGRLATQLATCHKHAAAFARGLMVIPEFTRAAFNQLLHDYPVFEGKASLIKLLLQFALQEAELFVLAHCSAEASEASQVAHMVAALQEAITAMDHGGEVLQASEAQDVCDGLRNYQKEYSNLASKATERGELLWKLRPKFHVVSHLADFVSCTRLTPKFWSCWMDEDFMAKCRQLCQRVRARGITVSRNALQRYIWLWAEQTFQSRSEGAPSTLRAEAARSSNS